MLNTACECIGVRMCVSCINKIANDIFCECVMKYWISVLCKLVCIYV